MPMANRRPTYGKWPVVDSPFDIASAKRLQNRCDEPADQDQLVVSPRRARFLLDIGNTHLYELLTAGELDSFLEGRSRKITMESIQRLISRRLAIQSKP